MPAESFISPTKPRVALHSSTLTFHFTDIEGSTSRWEHQRATMSPALVRHDAIVRAAIEDHGGQVFKTVGDAVCATFTRAADATLGARDLPGGTVFPWP